MCWELIYGLCWIVLCARSAFVRFLYCWKQQTYWWICWIYLLAYIEIMSHNCQITVLLEVLDPLNMLMIMLGLFSGLCWDCILHYSVFCLVGSNKHTDEYTCSIFCGLCWAFCVVGNFWAMVSSLTQQLNMLMKILGVFLWFMWRLCPADLSDLCTVASFRHKN